MSRSFEGTNVDAVGDLTIQAMAELGFEATPLFSQALRTAVREVKPLFGTWEYGELYREAAANPDWLAISLITNAEREGDGATRLWSLAASTPDPHLAAEVRQHGIDESMHSLAYLRMLDFTFPGSVDDGFRAALENLSPKFGANDQPFAITDSPYSHSITVDDLIQMNIAEIRTRIHHLLQRPMLLAHCPERHRARVRPILDRLLRDETRHVGYTARLIELHAIDHRDEVEDLMIRRLRDFNEITDDELDHRIFD